ncbi:MAG: type VI secretion system baseplate subunit TssK [Beijerinckiaceae bacterium]
MSWFGKVAWSEGLFLRPHHLQQADRYAERLVDTRTRDVTPYPWGFSRLEIDRDLAQQSKFALRSASGIMPDGTPFDLPADGPLPAPIDIPANAAKHMVWLSLPVIAPNTREIDAARADSGSRFVAASATIIDSNSNLRVEEDIDIAFPHLAFDIRKTPKSGHVSIGVARVLEVKDKAIVFDDRYVPPLLVSHAHATVDGWMDRIIGWMSNKLEELSRYAADPSAGGGLQTVDYFVLQLLNRHIGTLKHLRHSKYAHPERLYVELLHMAGELATFASAERLARDYPAYDHDNLENTFRPLVDDIQEFLSIRYGRRAIRLDLVERAENAFVSTIKDRSLFRNANFVIEVSARRPLTEIQSQFPHLFKVGPNTKMNDIVHAHLPGVPLIHMPTPPPQLRVMADHVYFLLDRTSPLWTEFSTASAVGFHFSGMWPDLELEFWAILGDRP